MAPFCLRHAIVAPLSLHIHGPAAVTIRSLPLHVHNHHRLPLRLLPAHNILVQAQCPRRHFKASRSLGFFANLASISVRPSPLGPKNTLWLRD